VALITTSLALRAEAEDAENADNAENAGRKKPTMGLRLEGGSEPKWV